MSCITIDSKSQILHKFLLKLAGGQGDTLTMARQSCALHFPEMIQRT